MIGRAALGNPWIFKQTKDYWNNGSYEKPTSEEIKNTILKHATLVQKYFGEKGFLTFRTHLAAYFKGFPNASTLREEAVKINKELDVKKIIKSIE